MVNKQVGRSRKPLGGRSEIQEMVKKILLIFAGIVAVSLLIFLIIVPHKFYVSIGLADRYEYWEQPIEESRGDSLYVDIRYDHTLEIANYSLVVKFNGGFYNTELENNSVRITNIIFNDSKGIEIKRFPPAGHLGKSEDGKNLNGFTLSGRIPLSISNFDILGEVGLIHKFKKDSQN